MIDFSSLAASPCVDSPPGEPNVFTDGAYKHPQTQRWGLGGFGVWWPSRCINDKPPSVCESTFSQWKPDGEGISFWGALPGHRCSSTRTELAAGIVAALFSGSVHQCSDSMAHIGKAKAILAEEFHRNPIGIHSEVNRNSKGTQ